MVLPPTDVVAAQSGPTSITVTWTPPSPLGDTTGYRIDYTGGCISDSVNVSGEFSNNHTITGLENGQIYTISIVSTSSENISPPVSGIFVPLGK